MPNASAGVREMRFGGSPCLAPPGTVRLRMLEITFLESDAEAYSFTFG
jgi:hypothetical protein